MYDIQLQIKLLGSNPLVFTWWNAEKMKLEGCLVTCKCQDLHLDNKDVMTTQEGPMVPQTWALRLAHSIQQAEILTLSEGLEAKSVLKEKLNEDLKAWLQLASDGSKNYFEEDEMIKRSVCKMTSFSNGTANSTENGCLVAGAESSPPETSWNGLLSRVTTKNTLKSEKQQSENSSASRLLPPRKRAKYKMGIEEEQKSEDSKVNQSQKDESDSRLQARNVTKEYASNCGDTDDGYADDSFEDDVIPLKELQKRAKSNQSRCRKGSQQSRKRQNQSSTSSHENTVGRFQENNPNDGTISCAPQKGRKGCRRKQANPSQLKSPKKPTKPSKVKPQPPHQGYKPPVFNKPVIYKGIQDLREYKELVQAGKLKPLNNEKSHTSQKDKWADQDSDSDLGDMDIAVSEVDGLTGDQNVQKALDGLSEVSDALAQTAKILEDTPGSREDDSAIDGFGQNFTLGPLKPGLLLPLGTESASSRELQTSLLKLAEEIAEREVMARPMNCITVLKYIPPILKPQCYEDIHSIKSYHLPEVEPENVPDLQLEEEEIKDSTYEKRLAEYLKFKDEEFLEKYKKYQNVEGTYFVLCEHCGKPMTNMSYKKHLARMHSNEIRERDYMCSVCGKQFLNEGNLDNHKLTHTNIRYKCGYCEKTYKQDYNRKAHEKTHFEKTKPMKPSRVKRNPANDRKVDCGVCGKTVKASSLKLHMNVHNTKRYTCEICGKDLKLTYKLQHMAMHRQNLKYSCPYCGKESATKQAMNIHVRTHTKERPLKCRYCDERFARHQARINHERRHTGEKPFRCDICNKCWRDFTTAWCHMRKHHPGVKLTNTQHMKGNARPPAPLEHDHLAANETSNSGESEVDSVQKTLQNVVHDMLEESQRASLDNQENQPQQVISQITLLPPPKQQTHPMQPQQHPQTTRNDLPATNPQPLLHEQGPSHLVTHVKQPQMTPEQPHHLHLQHQQIVPIQLQQPLQTALQQLRQTDPSMLQHQSLEAFQIPITIPTEAHHGLTSLHHPRQEHPYTETHHLQFPPYHSGYPHGY